MALQQDSIVNNGVGVQDDAEAPQHYVLTPRMVLSWLPRNATPAQQDSAIQAHFKPSEIRWSQRPDTLHLPGHDKGRNILDEQLPQYYKESFFSKDSMFHAELQGGRYGVAGDPIPYTIHGDNVISLLLLVAFLMAVVSVANVKDFIIRQVKSFIYWDSGSQLELWETGLELKFQLFLMALTGFLIALLFFYYSIERYGETNVLSSQYLLLGIYAGMTVAYFLVKTLLYTWVNNVFFDGKRNVQWMKSFLFITSLEGALLFPVFLLQAYMGLALEYVMILAAVAFVIVKILTIFRAYVIFFRRNVASSQIILYFCTLEAIPLFVFWAALELVANSLKINF